MSPYAEDYLDTINTLRIATRASSITSACMRLLNIPEEEILWKRYEEVKSTIAENRKHEEPKKPQPTMEFLDNLDRSKSSNRASRTTQEEEDVEEQREPPKPIVKDARASKNVEESDEEDGLANLQFASDLGIEIQCDQGYNLIYS